MHLQLFKINVMNTVMQCNLLQPACDILKKTNI